MMTRVTCESCNGAGEIWLDGEELTCGECDGQGFLVVDPFDTNEEARGER